MTVVGISVIAAVSGSAAYASTASQSPSANLGTLITTTPIQTGPASVNGACDGVPAGGSLGSVDYVLHATAIASSTGASVALATGVTCRIWNNVSVGAGWLSAPVSGSEPGPAAAGVGQVSIATNTNPIACVYVNALFTGNVPASSRSGSPCPTHP